MAIRENVGGTWENSETLPRSWDLKSKNIRGGENVALLIEGWVCGLDFLVCYLGHQITLSILTKKISPHIRGF